MGKGKKGLGLGKGLESLIEIPEEIEKADQPEIYLKISQVEPNRKQPRKNFDENAMEELAESVKQYGIIQPLIVRKKENYYRFIIQHRCNRIDECCYSVCCLSVSESPDWGKWIWKYAFLDGGG